ncbi:hypothetical protein LZD76_04590 [Lactobacillus mulieris]|uniref:hypothetical protein n=1 Tax=Lactobacillus mulieris TaxID=2508708 RepID=UPI001F157E36|nr:hypothetical protein [Lactobacillus mulieris]MCF1783727.1 hypothetical protein [Lactobacillus mulieris]MCW8104371.1 hypothetical protein [Lactobacillus mulieris]MDK6803219.1 hypothetical protein [Lactobacillus mulieris]MDK8382335.1 hypothetical protein [Lactobacillus mulieris]MDT9620564.1 hypothetical protein [Lactobacillus mulieris]
MKIVISMFMLFLAMGATACSNKNVQSSHKVHARVTAKAKRAKKKQAELNKKQALNKKAQEKVQKDKQQAASQSQNQSQSQQVQANQNQSQANSKESYEEYIGRLNRQRGYDPKGNPIMPGQDHEPGALPDGNPDPWVQDQINWEKENGYLNPDGSPTEKGKEAEREVEQNANSDDDYNY